MGKMERHRLEELESQMINAFSPVSILSFLTALKMGFDMDIVQEGAEEPVLFLWRDSPCN